MSAFTFKTPSGESFEIKMPSGATFEQAQAIFKQQVDTGGLVGFKVGDALNAATQAAGGLATAAASAGQTLSSAMGKLSPGTNLNTLTASVGTAATGALNQATAALSGSIPSVASLTTGASAGVNGLISGASSALSGAQTSLSSTISSIPGTSGTITAVSGTLTGIAAQAGSLANNAVKTITGAIGSTPLNGINVADFAKQGPSLGPIGNLSTSAVTGTLAQASKLIGQAADTMSNALGVGKFGLDASQLEKAGYLKPGSAAAFLSLGEQDLTAVLSSPLPWAGKDGVKGVGDILGNGNLQDKIQQGLMKTGLDSVKQLGLPVDKLSAPALGGVATLAAKDPAAAVSALTSGVGVPSVPGLGNLTDKVKDVMSNTAFAVKLTEDKVEPSLKQEEPAPAETNTVDTATVDAAGERIVGNDKVPTVSSDGAYAAAKTEVTAFVTFVGEQFTALQSVNSRITAIWDSPTISQEEWDSINQDFQAVRAAFNARSNVLRETAVEALKKVPQDKAQNLIKAFNNTRELAVLLVASATKIKEFLKKLAEKIKASENA